MNAAAASVEVETPTADGGNRALRWGSQIDVRPVVVCGDRESLTEEQVAAYVAKYATKGAEIAGTIDRPIRHEADIDTYPIPEHTSRMIRTCWRLGNEPGHAHLRLRAWAHMLGFLGHFSSKSRRYSTTLRELRRARADHRAAEARERHGLPDPEERPIQTAGEWRYAGRGYTPGEAILAADIRERVQTSSTASATQARRSSPRTYANASRPVRLQVQRDAEPDKHSDVA